MSRLYEMHVKIIGFDPKRQEAIEEAANDEWTFEEWSDNKKWIKSRKSKAPIEMSAYGQEQLCGGESEDEFARRMAKAIMKANGKPCEVQINATCMEDLPYTPFSFDEDDFKELTS